MDYSFSARCLCGISVLLAACGCWSSSPDEVVVYAALDREFSEPLLQDFEQQTSIRVLPKYDVESTKTVGLVSAIIQERQRPRCDVFWNNEILHTLRLQKLGMLESYHSPASTTWPKEYRSEDGQWIGFAARGRVLLVNTQLVPDGERPSSIEDLANEQWKGKVGMAKPLFGTTATHAAVLFAHWGEERAKEYYRRLKSNASILSGNKGVAEAVAQGELAFGITDTDDAIIELEKGAPVDIIFPDQDGMGALFIPNTLCIIRGSHNQAAARKLVDFLLQPRIEKQLASGASAQFPINPNVAEQPRVTAGKQVKWMTPDFAAAADVWENASSYLRSEFATAD